MCAICLLASELVTEFGLIPSQKCKPQTTNGFVTPDGPIITSPDITIGIIASAAHLQSIQFLDGDLTDLRVGFPHNVSSKVCLPCLTGTPALMDCTLRDGKSYPAGVLDIGVRKTPSVLSTVAVGFRGTDESERQFLGKGDLAHVGEKCVSFLFHAEGGSGSPVTVTYFEYVHQVHCKELMHKAGESPEESLWEPTRAATQTQKIQCGTSQLSASFLEQALTVFRTTQVENTVKPMAFDEIESRFARIREDDIYRAALALSLADAEKSVGNYSVYTACAKYNVVYLLPLIVSSLVLAGLLVWVYLGPRAAVQELPYSMSDVSLPSGTSEGHDGDDNSAGALKPKWREGWKKAIALEELCLECDNEHELMRVRPRRNSTRSVLQKRAGIGAMRGITGFRWLFHPRIKGKA